MNRLTLFLAAIALAVRVLVPAGFMPSNEKAFALIVCTGVDTQTIWMDSKGGLHKENPEKPKQTEHKACAFAGGVDSAPVAAAALDLVAPIRPDALPLKASTPAIGRGLASPPPPQTGPPVLT